MVYRPDPTLLIARLRDRRHLPGKHDQSSHGHGHGGGRTPEQFDADVAKAADSNEAMTAARVEPADNDEWVAVDEYGGNGYYEGNSALRASGGDSTQIEHEHLQRMVGGLDQMMARSTLDRDVVVKRGVSSVSRTFGGHEPVAGLEWVDHGYGSTTTGLFAGEQFTGESGAAMRILVPKGTHAFASPGLDSAEILLDRGLRFRIVRDNGPDYYGVRQLDVEVLGSAR